VSEQSVPSRAELRGALRSGQVPEKSAPVSGFPALPTPGDVWLSTAVAAEVAGIKPGIVTTMTSRTRNSVHVRENAWPAGIHVGRENYFPASEVLAWCDREYGRTEPADTKEQS
jgi:hypothetical protein